MKKSLLVLIPIFISLIFSQSVEIKDSDNNILLQINDLGTIGEVEIPGKMNIDGNIYVSSGIRKEDAGSCNLIPYAYGYVSVSGTISGDTDNFTVSHPSTGIYDINFSPLSYQYYYTTIVTPYSSATPVFATAYKNSINLRISMWNVSGSLQNYGFHFITFIP